MARRPLQGFEDYLQRGVAITRSTAFVAKLVMNLHLITAKKEDGETVVDCYAFPMPGSDREKAFDTTAEQNG